MAEMWKFVAMDGFKAHYVPPELYEDLVKELAERAKEGEGTITHDEDAEQAWTERGGMCSTKEPVWESESPPFATHCRDLRHYLNELETLPERQFDGGAPYYKIHGWMHCVVFTPEQRDQMIESMREGLEDAEEQARGPNEHLERVKQSLAAQGKLYRPPIPINKLKEHTNG